MTGTRATVGLHRKLTAPNLTRYNHSMNIMKGTTFIKVYDGNNSNSVCFVGNYVNLRTSLWELITHRVIWNPWASPSGFNGRDQHCTTWWLKRSSSDSIKPSKPRGLRFHRICPRSPVCFFSVLCENKFKIEWWGGKKTSYRGRKLFEKVSVVAEKNKQNKNIAGTVFFISWNCFFLKLASIARAE